VAQNKVMPTCIDGFVRQPSGDASRSKLEIYLPAAVLKG
jgi:hypothetical protein